MHLKKRKEVILGTAKINLISKKGDIFQARALLDSASQTSFVTKNLINRLNLNLNKVSMTVIGIGNTDNVKKHGRGFSRNK